MDNLDFYKRVAIEIAEAQGHSVDKDRLDEVFPAIIGGAALRGAAKTLLKPRTWIKARAASKQGISDILTRAGRTAGLERRRRREAAEKAAEKEAAEKEAAEKEAAEKEAAEKEPTPQEVEQNRARLRLVPRNNQIM